jgi:GTP-binding protein LepA
VAGYLSGGDRSRKMKLWKQQKEGKKRLKERSSVEIPQEVFVKMIRNNDN